MPRYRSMIYKKDYITYWLEKGEYGKTRVDRMRDRKRKRFEKWHRRKQRTGIFRDHATGKMMQVCEYQPLGYGTMYCEYPCNGDC